MTIKFEILSQEEFSGEQFSGNNENELAPLGGALDNGNVFGLGEWTYQFEVKVSAGGEERQFTVAFQPEERNNGMKAYSGYDLSPAGVYGYDADESDELVEFCDHDTTVLDALCSIAKTAAKAELERLLSEKAEEEA